MNSEGSAPTQVGCWEAPELQSRGSGGTGSGGTGSGVSHSPRAWGCWSRATIWLPQHPLGKRWELEEYLSPVCSSPEQGAGQAPGDGEPRVLRGRWRGSAGGCAARDPSQPAQSRGGSCMCSGGSLIARPH